MELKIEAIMKLYEEKLMEYIRKNILLTAEINQLYEEIKEKQDQIDNLSSHLYDLQEKESIQDYDDNSDN